MNEIVDVPFWIFTDAGTDAADGLELVSDTVAPVVAATPLSMTAPVTPVEDPPTTVVGVKLRLAR